MQIFAKRADAWAWMRYCDDIGHMAGWPYPTEDGNYAVKYIPNGKKAKK